MVKMNKETEYEKDLNEMKEQILKEGNTLLTKRDLLERFCKIDKEYDGHSWNLLQILANINILIGQEPCDDAISRTQALSDYADWYGYGYIENTFYKLLKNMPPVQPKPKVGYWIDTNDYHYYNDGDIETTELRCSCCNEVVEWDIESPHKPYYCENCGTRMVESQESEKTE
jgi:hypothetical protein